VAQAAEQHTLLFVIGSIVFWTLLWPLALVWFALSRIDRHAALDKSPLAKRQRRVARLMRWYPAEWRARYGDEMTALLHDTIADGHAGPRLSLNIAREGLAVRVSSPARRHTVAGICLLLCWIPLVPQGLVAAGLKTFGTPTRSWFVALYAPSAYQWPLIAAMVALGLTMLAAGITLAKAPAARV
jgi:hypothetical protein